MNFSKRGQGILFVVVYVAFLGCSSPKAAPPLDDNKFPVISPVVKDTTYFEEYVADIQAIRNIEIRARVDAHLETIHVDEGDFVRKGQMLFSLSTAEYKEALTKAGAALKRAIADYKSGEVDLQNTRALVENRVVSASELVVAEAKVEALQAQVEEARALESGALLRLRFTEIRAPFDGIVNRIPNKIGSVIREGDLLTTLSDNQEVFAYFNVSEREYLDLYAGGSNGEREVQLVLANSKMHIHNGRVETVEGQIDRRTGNIAFRARFANPDRVLKHGSSGKVRLHKTLKEALIIPQKSTFEIQDKLFVYVLDSDNRVRMRSFVPEQRLQHAYVVGGGLSPDDRILFEGIQLVSDGDAVTPEPVSFLRMLTDLSDEARKGGKL